jgi:hypothetical protein
MKKWRVNYILFAVLLLLGLIQAISGFLLWLVIPGGHRGFGIGQVTGDFLWSRYTWIEIHDWTAFALVIVVIVHIIVHWKWILETSKKIIGTRK